MGWRGAGILALGLLRALPAAAEDRCAECVRPDLAQRLAPAARFVRATVSPSENAYVPLRLAAELMRAEGLSLRLPPCDLAAAPPAAAIESVDANALSLWLLGEAATKPAFQWPGFEVGEESFHRYRQVFELEIVEARREASEHQPARAATRLGAAIGLAHEMANGEAQLIHALVALYIERRLLEEIRCIAAAEDVDEDALRTALDAVVATPPICQVRAQALKVELNTFWLPNAQKLEASGEWRGPPLGEAVQRAGDALAAHIDACGQPIGLSCADPRDPFAFDVGAYDGVFWQTGAERVATETNLALRLYVKQHGRLPASLDDLVQSGLLRALPRDPLSGSELGYDAGQRKLWLDVPQPLISCFAKQQEDRLTWSL